LRLRILVFVTGEAKDFRVRPKMEQESLFRKPDGRIKKREAPESKPANPDVEKIG
jgi:hypothetical protein